MGPKGKATCSIGLDKVLDKSKQNAEQLAGPSAYSAGALAPQKPPKSRECLTSLGQDRENRTREVLVRLESARL